MERFWKHIRRMVLVCTAIVLCSAVLCIGSNEAQASDSYKSYDLSTKKQQIGSYWFKTSSSYDSVYIASSKNGTYRKVTLSYEIITNGKTYAYSIKGKSLYRVNLKTRKAVKLKGLSSYLKNEACMEVAALKNGNLYLNWLSFDAWDLKLYAYNLKSGKIKLARSKCNITDIYGSYAVTQDEFRTDASEYQTTLLKLTSTGVKKIRVLSKYGRSECFVGGKVYWVNYPNIIQSDGYTYADMHTAQIYRCNPNGTGKKLMKKISFKNREIYGAKMYSTYCILYTNCGEKTVKY